MLFAAAPPLFSITRMIAMPFDRSALLPALLLAATLALSGCQSAEEKAEDYYQSGLALLAQGDEDRALVEFRNVFKYNGFHQEARKTYADLMVKRGNLSEAYSQYLRLIEQYPDLVEVRLTLAEMAMGQNDWDEVERHGRAAVGIDPNLPRARAIALVLDYRDAARARDEAKRAELAAQATTLLTELPDSLVLRRVVIDAKSTGPDPMSAMPEIEAALALDPENLDLHTMKLRLLGGSGDTAGAGAQLKTMVALFPTNEDLKQAYLRWMMSEKDYTGAEAFLRAEAGDVTGDTEKHLKVVQFLNIVQGADAGRAELNSLIKANDGTERADFYGAVLASMDFEQGKQDDAIAALEAILAKAADSDQTRDIKATLARMLDATGARDRAEALVAEVLTADASNVDALKQRAAWAIAGDRPGDAILDLRTAQGQAPRDAQIMTLLAAAFERDGNLDLAGEQLAKAVETSGNGAEEALRYARFLRQQDRAAVAETVLTDARRVAPENPMILGALAELHLAEQKWAQAKEIAEALRGLGTENTIQAAAQIDAAILLGQDQVDEGLAILEQQASGGTPDLRSTVVVVTAQLRAGKTTEARAFLDDALTRTPDEPVLRLLSASVETLMGKTDSAEAIYRKLIADDPKSETPVRMLYGLLTTLGRAEDATAVLDAGLAEMPDNGTLLWIKAGLLEKAGDFDGTIAIYEKLYEADSSNVIAANNLASMITAHRDDAESLERAFAIARRLRESSVPAFQDTYGWIEYRRGNAAEALPHLEPASKGLPEDAMVQFHLGMAYADLDRKDEAAAQFRRALELWGDTDLPQKTVAESRLKELTAAP